MSMTTIINMNVSDQASGGEKCTGSLFSSSNGRMLGGNVHAAEIL
jgi:hypothetical protein